MSVGRIIYGKPFNAETAREDRDFDTILLTGGGTDSAVAAAWLHASGKRPLMFHVDMGSDGITEAALAQARHYNMPMYILDGKEIFKFRSPEDRYIPGYRLLLISLACSVADRFELQTLYNGEYSGPKEQTTLSPGDELLRKMLGPQGMVELNPTQRNFFVHVYSQTYQHEGHFQMIEPFLGFTKAQILTLGHALHLPWEKTVTCRRVRAVTGDLLENHPEIAARNPHSALTSRIYHCGEPDCYFCVHRREAFRTADLIDPAPYILPE